MSSPPAGGAALVGARVLADKQSAPRATTTALVWIALNISYYGLFLLWLPFVLQAEKQFSIDVYLLLDPERALPVPGLRGGDLAGGTDRPQAHPGRLSWSLGGVAAFRLRARRTTERLRDRPVLRRLLQPRGLGRGLPYTSEPFPTRLRSTAFGVVEGVGKAAAIAGPYLFGYLTTSRAATAWSLTFVAAVMAAGGLVAAIFGRETRGRALA